ncbi:uncharacterized protein L3040_003556 [Drepanopeziza brunnea f. sp. 'multigermtubi']|uniref:uncharacterized protein n=1 Tax=Drepanopeziza brunnea f. sp. 'multigermtubi' TaxID=698441 RepID=UPI00238BF0FF|nr:hypothetical protein L3040_003556 [Drepanopeziza brunnea f. sp. 'multigermtubi']
MAGSKPVKFYGSQVGGSSTTPHSYTGSPWVLLQHDIASAFHYILFLPFIIFPLFPLKSGPLCELYPSSANLYDISLHIILILLQLPFVLSVPFWVVFPLWWVLIGVAVFVGVNEAICWLLNGKEMEVWSKDEYVEGRGTFENEQWIFLNGVAAGNWLQNNVDRLALTFGRPVLGVHNRTNGIIFDVVQCLIQRNFTYATQDVRDCYQIIKRTLYQPHLTKVIFILHSQGGIMGGMIIDWLLQEVPQDLLAKLEVYTFGNAANHFNNPHLHLLSQQAALRSPSKPYTTKTTTSVHYHDPLPNGNHHQNGNRNGNGDSNGTVLSPPATHSQTSRQQTPSGKAIRYIEHYAHTADFVARWGVLHFTTAFSSSSSLSPMAPRFMGRVFEREGKGHQMNMHYLDAMFPLKPAPAPTPPPPPPAPASTTTPPNPSNPNPILIPSVLSRIATLFSLRSWPRSSSKNKNTTSARGGIGNSGFLGCDDTPAANAFMESVLELGAGAGGGGGGKHKRGVDGRREGWAMSYLGAHGEPLLHGGGEKEEEQEEEREREGSSLRDNMSPIWTGKRGSRMGMGMSMGMTPLEARDGRGSSSGSDWKLVNGDRPPLVTQSNNGKIKDGGAAQDRDTNSEDEEREEERERKMKMKNMEKMKEMREMDMRFQVKDFSRLWLYRNGRSPMTDETDMGIMRMATL